MKKIIYILIGIIIATTGTVYAVTVFDSNQVGTGSVNGYVLQTTGAGNKSLWVSTASIADGNGTPHIFATTTNQNGQHLIYTPDTLDTVGTYCLGGNSTSTCKFYFEMEEGRIIIKRDAMLGIGTSTPGTPLSVVGAGVFTDHVRAPFFYATSTTATSTFLGRIGTVRLTTDSIRSTDIPNCDTIDTDPYGNFRCGTDTSGSSAGFPFTPALNFGVNNNATTGIAWFQNALNASSTSHFDFASSTQLTVTDSLWLKGLVTGGLGINSDGKVYAGATSTLTTISGILPVGSGGTGNTTFTNAQLLYGNGTGSVGSVATSSASCTTGAACTTFTVVGAVSPSITATLGTAITPDELNPSISTGNILIGTNGAGTAFIATGTPTLTVGNLVATTTATSTFGGGVMGLTFNATSTTASSTFANGINLTSGCFAVNGTCITAGVAAAQGNNSFAYPFPGNATSTLLSFNGGLIASSATTTGNHIISTGNLGIGTSTPGTPLSVTGAGLFTGRVMATNFIATSTTATSTFNAPITMENNLDNFIIIEADADNVTETDNAYLKLAQDGEGTIGLLGFTGLDDTDSEGQTATGADGANNGLILTNRTTGGKLQFGTVNTVRMTIDSSGNVGLGTNAPSVAFQVGPESSTATPAQAFFAQWTTAAAGIPQFLGNWNSTGRWGIGQASGSNDQALRAGLVNSTSWDSNQTAFKFIVGNLGAGTSSPGTNLGVTGAGVFTGTVTAPIFYATSTTATSTYLGGMVVNNSIGVGTSSPFRTFSVNGTVAMKGLNTSTAGNAICILPGSDIVTAGGATCATSARETKHDILNVSKEEALNILLKLNPVSFTFNESGDRRVGFIANEVDKIDPRLVDYAKEDIKFPNSKLIKKGAPLGVEYDNITSILTKGFQKIYFDVQSLLGKVSGLEEKVNTQQKEIDLLKQRLDKLENNKK